MEFRLHREERHKVIDGIVVFFSSNFWARLTLVTLVMSLFGCGFQIRSWDYMEMFSEVSVITDDSIQFSPVLERELQKAGLLVVDSRKKGVPILVLSEEQQSQRTYSYSTKGRMVEYELMLKVNLRVLGADHEVILDRDISTRRIGRIDQHSLIGSSEQRSLIVQQMHMDMTQRIMRSLGVLVQSEPAKREP